MQDHFDRTIKFNDESDLQNLYSWSINEYDAAGKKTGHDYIPWKWTLYFRANSITLTDITQIGDRYALPDKEPGAKIRRSIVATLHPDDRGRYAPSYSMMGTERTIADFNLFIEEADRKGERCVVSGGVSYTTDIDFRDVTRPDIIEFYFYVTRERFDELAHQIAAKAVDALTIRLGGVQGFYSDWSPGITTDRIKVLTRDRKHEVQSVKDEMPLPRLGEVEEAELSLSTKFVLPVEPACPDSEPDDAEEADNRPIDRAARLAAARDSRGEETLKIIASLRMAAWVIAALLLIGLLLAR